MEKRKVTQLYGLNKASKIRLYINYQDNSNSYCIVNNYES
jgi:hypothetical protein